MGQLLVRTIGFRQAELALALGTLFSPDRAQSIGLVDETVHQQQQLLPIMELSNVDGLSELLPSITQDQASDTLMQKAYQQAKIFAKIPPHARVASKLVTRQSHIRDMVATRDEDTAHFCGFVMQDAVQKNLMTYVEAMKSKSKKK
jgi:enoyl-CoA hydratase/carnithine racemase